MVNDSYFIISRNLFDSAIWRDDPHVLKLFIWLIGTARHDIKPKKYPSVTINRGELVTSLSEIVENNEYVSKNAIRKWSRAKVSRMLNRLQKEGYISIVSDTYGTHISICNYCHYQDPERYKADRSETGVKQECNGSETGRGINNNDNNVKKDKEKPIVPENKFSENDFRLASLLKKLTMENYPNQVEPKESYIKKWGDYIRLLRTQDKKKKEEIEKVLIWSQDDIFWKQNIRSGKSLRKHYDNLYIKMTENKKKEPEGIRGKIFK